MTGEISFFELGVEDADKARAFYGGLFGWTFEPVPPGSGYSVTTPNIPGGVHGGDSGAGAYLFFEVDDLDVALARVVALGGMVEAGPGGHDDHANSTARFGRFRFCRDDQGSPFGLHQPPASEAG
ncbi:VOC family protein [Streptomyces sp. NPDC000410]|uniref:VOC family protein n=1 Tax=Streptomyces sp. NPDC000410 TaxID=3154254 RepID=UPI00332EF44C